MQFLIIGRDGEDKEALSRRMAVRKEHIALGELLLASGNMWYGAAILNDQGQMCGSTLFMDFESEKELQEWLDKEPYVTGDVWRTVEIIKCSTRDPWQFNRPKEFFLKRQSHN